MSDIVKFGERLSEQMFYKQATPDSLAERLGLNKYDIYHWQKGNGKFMPKVEALVTLADYFECSIEFLIGLEEENSLPEPKRERRPFSFHWCLCCFRFVCLSFLGGVGNSFLVTFRVCLRYKNTKEVSENGNHKKLVCSDPHRPA